MRLPSVLRNESDFWMEPSRRVSQLQRQFDRLFEDFQREMFMPSSTWSTSAIVPACDMEEVADHYVLSMDLPGVKKEDIRIDLQDHMLIVTGERREEKEEKQKGTYRSERSYGAFERSFALPREIKAEQITSEYRDGVLRIAIPKLARSQAQHIKIGEAKPGFFDRLLGSKTEKTAEKAAEKAA